MQEKKFGTQYIDRGWSVPHIYKRELLLLSSDIDVGRGNKTKCIFFPALKHAKTKLQVVRSSE